MTLVGQMFSPPLTGAPHATPTPTPTPTSVQGPDFKTGTIANILTNSMIDIFASKFKGQGSDPKLVSLVSSAVRLATNYLTQSKQKENKTQQPPDCSSIYEDIVPPISVKSITSNPVFLPIMDSLMNCIIEPLTSKMKKQGCDPKMIDTVSDALKLLLNFLFKFIDRQAQKPTQLVIDMLNSSIPPSQTDPTPTPVPSSFTSKSGANDNDNDNVNANLMDGIIYAIRSKLLNQSATLAKLVVEGQNPTTTPTSTADDDEENRNPFAGIPMHIIEMMTVNGHPAFSKDSIPPWHRFSSLPSQPSQISLHQLGELSPPPPPLRRGVKRGKLSAKSSFANCHRSLAPFEINVAKCISDSTFVIKAMLPGFTDDEINLNFIQKNKYLHILTITTMPKKALGMPTSSPVETFVCTNQLQKFVRGDPIVHPSRNFISIKNEWSKLPMSREISLRIPESSGVSPSSTLVDGILTVTIPFTPPKVYTGTTIPITKHTDQDCDCKVVHAVQVCNDGVCRKSQSGNRWTNQMQGGHYYSHPPLPSFSSNIHQFSKLAEPCTELIHLDINGRVVHPSVSETSQSQSQSSSSSYPTFNSSATIPWLNSHNSHKKDPRAYSSSPFNLGMPRPPWTSNNDNSNHPIATLIENKIPTTTTTNDSGDFAPSSSIQEQAQEQFVNSTATATAICDESNSSRLDSLAEAAVTSSPQYTSDKSVHIYSADEWD